VDPYTKKAIFFIPDGIGSKFGYVHKWIGLGIHSGLNWEWSNKLVVALVFANLRLSPKLAMKLELHFKLIRKRLPWVVVT
jgi:hypothetical protein